MSVLITEKVFFFFNAVPDALTRSNTFELPVAVSYVPKDLTNYGPTLPVSLANTASKRPRGQRNVSHGYIQH